MEEKGSKIAAGSEVWGWIGKNFCMEREFFRFGGSIDSS